MDDDISIADLYLDGHWEWDNKTEQLVFISRLDNDSCDNMFPQKFIVIGDMKFKDDMDLLEERRFRKKYQRRMREGDVVTLQDVKDLALYMTPTSILTTSIVNFLHLPASQRFLRALILYCHYYLQIVNELSRRSSEHDTKIRSVLTDQIKENMRDNLEDLRLLVAKEYSIIILAGGEYRPYHHMGPFKTKNSLYIKDCIRFESLLCISIQIVWLALERQSFNLINTEINRLFKSPTFNNVDRNAKSKTELSKENQYVLTGCCMKTSYIIHTFSPLTHELFCRRQINFQMLGLGVIKFPTLSSRLLYLEQCLIASENQFPGLGISLGIIGQPRARYDTMLRKIVETNTDSNINLTHRKLSISRTSRLSKKICRTKSYPDLKIPAKVYNANEYAPKKYPDKTYPYKKCDDVQRKKWLARVLQSKSGRGKNMGSTYSYTT